MSMSKYANRADYWKAQAEKNAQDAERYRELRALLAGDAPMIREAKRIIDMDYVWLMDAELDAAISGAPAAGAA